MLRKVYAVSAIAMILVSAACNSITGPSKLSHSSGSGDPVRPPVELDKVCLDELRAVEIVTPAEGAIVHSGDQILVQWDVEQFCTGYSAAVKVSYDGGHTFATIAQGSNNRSATWRIPVLDDAAPVLKVEVSDAQGMVAHDIGLDFFRASNGPPTPKRDQQRD